MNTQHHANLEVDESGLLRLSGTLDFSSVPGLWEQCRAALASAATWDIDLGQVEHSNSAGLSLLLSCLREAERVGKTVHFLNVPSQMLDIARVSDLDQLLKISPA